MIEASEVRPLGLRRRVADIAIIGGAGHVGLPLAIVLANKRVRVLIYDIDRRALDLIRTGIMPFNDRGAEPLLRDALSENLLILSDDPSSLAAIPTVIITVGTPVDEFHNPTFTAIKRCADELIRYVQGEGVVILRSTVYPGVTDWLDEYFHSQGKQLYVAFCPERVLQGYAVEELQRLPQIVGATSSEAERRASKVFELFSPEIICLSPRQAELAKLFSNAYRYIQFAASNQFYEIACLAGVDYYPVLDAMKKGYERLADLPKAGFTAGPCLFKDTMQLSAFFKQRFILGHSAMVVNEGLPLFILDQIEKKRSLKTLTVGLLGMAFKADSDDPRSSLSYKLKKQLYLRAKEVLTTDPYVTSDPDVLPLDEVITKSDILILCTPHSVYRDLDTRGKMTVDVWNFYGQGGLF
ncbi:MAG: nucleotide sugar dehydrogenase [Candidatus Binatia bacterium]